MLCFQELYKGHAVLKTQLNEGQKRIYDCVMDAVNAKKGGLFFVYGHGGTSQVDLDLKIKLF